ncbi:unnamed protein product, partial [marine sediment metagenome]
MILIVGISTACVLGVGYIIHNKENVLDVVFMISSQTRQLFITNDQFRLKTAYLYYDINKYLDVTYFFIKDKQNIKEMIEKGKIDKSIFDYLCSSKNSFKIDPQQMRIKFEYEYDNNSYITYYSYDNGIRSDKKLDDYDNLDYPLINKEKMDNFRDKDIINGFFEEKYKDIDDSFYITCKSKLGNIQKVLINGEEDERLLKLFNRIKGYFNDYGMLENNCIKSSWIYDEYDIDKEAIIEIHQGLYLDEITFDLRSDILRLEYNNEYIIS